MRAAKVFLIGLLFSAFFGAVFVSEAIPLEMNVRGLYSIAVVFAALSTIASLAYLISGRLPASFALSAAAAWSLIAVSKTKYSYLQTKLLFHDVYYQFRDFAQIEFFTHYYRETVAAGALWLFGCVCVVGIYWQVFGRRPRTVLALAASLACLAGSALLLRVNVEKAIGAWTYVFSRTDSEYLSGFIYSARDFARSSKAEFALTKAEPSIPLPVETANRGGPIKPNIIIILHESSVDPAIYFKGKEFDVPSSFFESGDGKQRRLRVETWGGGTWLTEYGLLLGVDVNYFNEFKGFLGIVGVDAFKNTLPQDLRAQGYRTVALYPSPPTFMNTNRFYPSIGFDEVLGKDKIKLTGQGYDRPRDREFYSYLLKDIEGRLLQPERKPMLYFVWTLATHAPYLEPVQPSSRSDEIKLGNGPAEFARRQRMAADDLAGLEMALSEKFPNEPFMLVGFGDHHPTVTREYYYRDGVALGHLQDYDPNETMLKTYFRIKGVHFEPNFSALPDYLEVGFLGGAVLDAARLKDTVSNAARRWLRDKCMGEWSECKDTSAVMRANAILSTGESSIFQNR